MTNLTIGAPTPRPANTAVAFRDDARGPSTCLPISVTVTPLLNLAHRGTWKFSAPILKRVSRVAGVSAGSTGDVVEIAQLAFFNSYAAGVWVGGTARVYRYDGAATPPTWTEIGVETIVSSDDPVDTFELAAAIGVQVNDLVFIDRTVDPSENYEDITSSRLVDLNGGLRPAPYLSRESGEVAAGTTVELRETADTGESYWRITVPAGETSALRDNQFAHGDTTFYTPVPEGTRARYDVEMRRVSGTGNPTFAFAGNSTPATTFTIAGSDWETHSYIFVGDSVTDTGGKTLPALFTLPEGVWDIRRVIPYRDDPGDDPTKMEPALEAALDDFAPSMLRTHAFVKTGTVGYSLWGLLDRNGAAGASLTQQLEVCASLGVGINFQLEYHLTDAEQLGLIEFLAAPYDPATDSRATKPWAWKRWVLTGRTAPYTDVLPIIGEEDGNENWNTSSGFVTFPGDTGAPSVGVGMGAWLNRITAVRKSSPYWSAYAAKRLALPGGWIQMGRWTIPQLDTFKDGEVATANIYGGLGSWEEGSDGGSLTYSTEYLARCMQVVPTRWEIDFADWQDRVDALNVGRAVKVRLGGYEQNHTTPVAPSAGIAQAEVDEQDRTWGSKAIQTSIVDTFLSFAAHGAYVQNWFALDRDQYWGSHQPLSRGGAPRAAWLWLGLLNRLGMQRVWGTFYLTGVPANVLDRNGAPFNGAHQTAVYYLERDGTALIVMVNRNIPGHYDAAGVGDDGVRTIAARVPRGFTAMSRWTMSGVYSDHNTTLVTKDTFALSETAMGAPGRVVEWDVPPGDLVVFALV